MRKLVAIAVIGWICAPVGPARAQQIDLGFHGGALSLSGLSSTSLLPEEGGGAFIGFNGDVLIKRHLGVQGEVNWKAGQGLYGSQFPYWPIFFDFNAIYSRRFISLTCTRWRNDMPLQSNKTATLQALSPGEIIGGRNEQFTSSTA